MKFTGILASAALAFTMAVKADAATIDFTDIDIWASGASTDVVLGSTVSLSSSGTITQNLKGAPGPISPLQGESDGLGVGDDEITRTQSITVNFSSPLRVLGFYVLDFFLAPGGGDEEQAVVTFDDGTSTMFTADEDRADGGFGFAELTIPGKKVSSITFEAATGNDAAGKPDYALAGIEVAIPLPPAAWLLLSSIVGMGLLARGRSTKI